MTKKYSSYNGKNSMNRYTKEIAEQGKAFSSLIKYLNSEEFTNTIKKLDLSRITNIVFTGMGSSYFATFPAVFYLNEILMIPVYNITTRNLIHYYRNMIRQDTLLIVISQSGESIEIKKLLEILESHPFKLGITNTPTSTLAKKLDSVLFINAGEEKSTTSKTYLNTIGLTLKLGEMIAQDKEFALVDIPQKIGKFLQEEEYLLDIFSPCFLGTEYITLLGHGPSMATVLQGSLILKEASHFLAEGMETADFRHGPLDMVGEGFRAIIFSPYDEKYIFEKDIELAKKIKRQGGNLLFVTNKKIDEEFPVFSIEEDNPYLLPILEIIPLQFISCKIAYAKGMVPGTLSNIGKIVTK